MSTVIMVGGPSPWITFSAALVGGGVIGSLASTYMTAGREGRAARARVRECLFTTENTRWFDTDYQEFRQALSRLEAVALMARVPRELILRYEYVAEVAHYTEISERAEKPDLPARSLPLELAALLALIIAILSRHLWHPWTKRTKHDLWVIDKRIERLRALNPRWAWHATLLMPQPQLKQPGVRGMVARRRIWLSAAPRKWSARWSRMAAFIGRRRRQGVEVTATEQLVGVSPGNGIDKASEVLQRIGSEPPGDSDADR